MFTILRSVSTGCWRRKGLLFSGSDVISAGSLQHFPAPDICGTGRFSTPGSCTTGQFSSRWPLSCAMVSSTSSPWLSRTRSGSSSSFVAEFHPQDTFPWQAFPNILQGRFLASPTYAVPWRPLCYQWAINVSSLEFGSRSWVGVVCSSGSLPLSPLSAVGGVPAL